MSFTDQFLVKPGHAAKIRERDPGFTADLKKDPSAGRVGRNIARMGELQYLLWAENRRSLLIVLQGMDTCGKDGLIRHVMTGMNPAGCKVTSFKAPSAEELDHDFLWRIHRAVPGKGEIGVFNRSHYEDVLIVRVHEMVPGKVWRARYEQINVFEKLLTDGGVHVLKFFLHISKAEQKERLLKRLADPARNWKFSLGDLGEREHWDRYEDAYENALTRCSTEHAPWYVIPADKKWFRDLAVSAIITAALEGMEMELPKVTFDPASVRIGD